MESNGWQNLSENHRIFATVSLIINVMITDWRFSVKWNKSEISSVLLHLDMI